MTVVSPARTSVVTRVTQHASITWGVQTIVLGLALIGLGLLLPHL